MKLSTTDVDRLTASDSELDERDLAEMDFVVQPAPFGFFRLAKAGAITWPLNSIVYVNDAGGMWTQRDVPSQLAVLAHESVHVGQRRRLGRIRFLLAYMGLRVLTIGRSAANHTMEREGYRIQQKVREHLRATGDQNP
jgi:hypothetical protein